MPEIITKKVLAQKCGGASSYMIRKWCNVDFFKELSEMGYKKTQKEFTPKQAAFLIENIVDF